MSAKQRLEDLKKYFDATRQCGHTTAMIRGAQNVDDVAILAANHLHAASMKNFIPSADCFSFYNLDQLKGIRKPLLLDNYTMQTLLSDALGEIERLERKVSNLSTNNLT